MASYQDIDLRLKVIEDKVEFLMRSLRMRAATGQPFLGPDGKQAMKVVEGSMMDFYLMSKQDLSTVLQSDSPNLMDNNDGNGTDINQ